MARERVSLGLIVTTALAFCAAAVAQEKPPPTEPEKKLDDLSGRLVRKAVGESDEDVMDGVVRLMGESAKRIEIDFDPGAGTQEVQKEIGDKLDDAIKLAASRTRSRRQTSESKHDDRRQMPTKPKPAAPSKATPKPGHATQSADDSTSAVQAGATNKDDDRADLHDPRRAWGNLPRREREEMIQGAGEGFLERYREWVERYYRALQERE